MDEFVSQNAPLAVPLPPSDLSQGNVELWIKKLRGWKSVWYKNSSDEIAIQALSKILSKQAPSLFSDLPIISAGVTKWKTFQSLILDECNSRSSKKVPSYKETPLPGSKATPSRGSKETPSRGKETHKVGGQTKNLVDALDALKQQMLNISPTNHSSVDAANAAALLAAADVGGVDLSALFDGLAALGDEALVIQSRDGDGDDDDTDEIQS